MRPSGLFTGGFAASGSNSAFCFKVSITAFPASAGHSQSNTCLQCLFCSRSRTYSRSGRHSGQAAGNHRPDSLRLPAKRFGYSPLAIPPLILSSALQIQLGRALKVPPAPRGLTPRSTRTQPAPAGSSNNFPGFFAPVKIMSPAGPVNFFR